MDHIFLALAGPLILLLGLWRLWHGDRTTAAEWRGKTDARLIAVERDIKELKLDMREVKADVNTIKSTLARIEKNGVR